MKALDGRVFHLPGEGGFLEACLTGGIGVRGSVAESDASRVLIVAGSIEMPTPHPEFSIWSTMCVVVGVVAERCTGSLSVINPRAAVCRTYSPGSAVIS